MKVLVTGHTGYIGSLMVPTLQAAGHDVVGLDVGYFSDCNFLPVENPARAIRKDLRDLTMRDLDGFEAVVHLAALSNDPIGAIRPDLTHKINHGGSRLLAQLAKAAGVQRFLFSSSCSMYGASPHEELLTEDAPFHPMTAYAESKVEFEEDLRALASDTFSPICLRNATAYGVSPWLRVDLVLNNLVGWACTTGKVRIMSDGTPWRPVVHVADICRVFALVLDAPIDLVHNRAFNVGQSSENYRVRDLAAIVRDTVPGCEIEYAGVSGPDARNYRVDFSRFHDAFPLFQFQWTARSGAEQLYRAYQKVGLKPSDLEGRKYVRFNQLKHLMSEGVVDSELRFIRH